MPDIMCNTYTYMENIVKYCKGNTLFLKENYETLPNTIGVKHWLLKRMPLTSAGSQGVHPITVRFTHCAVLVSHDAVTTDSCGGLSADIITLVGGSISETQNIPISYHTKVNADVHDANSAAT